MDEYIQRYPEIDEIHLCLDDDETGKDTINQIEEEWSKKGYKTKVKLPINGKDYNKSLLALT